MKKPKADLINKELEILRNAVDKAEKTNATKEATSPLIKNILNVVEKFLKDGDLICYGGTAINNILPKKVQFYNKDYDIPDYDFFSPNALQDTYNLANIYYNLGFKEVEAKSGVHAGTYKVFVNYIPVADITQLDNEIFTKLREKAIRKNNIMYAPANYLRMALYLELSRPSGDVSRWEKVFKRLVLLNKYHPLKANKCAYIKSMHNCDKDIPTKKMFDAVRNAVIDLKFVFFGGYAMQLYNKLMHTRYIKYLHTCNSPFNPTFDILALYPLDAANDIRKKLEKQGITDVVFDKKSGVGEIIAPHYEIIINGKSVLFIYEPLACHSYNTIKIQNKTIRVATIDTMLSFYLAFLYSDREYYDDNRLLCMSDFLFKAQAKNKLQQKGVLKRFSTTCYGNQPTLKSMRAEKAEKFKELKNDKTSLEYQKYFLRYVPNDVRRHRTRKIRKHK
jgi:hypothetical protein